MRNKEFYTCDGRIYCLSDGKVTEITERDGELTDALLEKVEGFYPEAYRALCSVYSGSSLNHSYYRFLMARRFVKCNFGELDTTEPDIDDQGVFHFERVACPMRGECRYDGIICMPRFCSRLSAAEMRVMRLYYVHKDIGEIAERLYLSAHTVRNHIKAAYAKLGVHTRGEFVSYAGRHNLFG